MRAISAAAAAAALLASGLLLAACDSFDPLDKFQELDIMSSSKTPLKGERRPVFPEGVPGVPEGVPPELVKGYQPPAEAPPPVVEAKPVKPKPKKTAAVPRKPKPQQQQQPQPQQQPQQQAEQPAPRTTTQPVNQSAGGMQTMPGAQPTWPTNAPPAPGPWAGPTR
jgi:outer membrane biosynthesis protein TonB